MLAKRSESNQSKSLARLRNERPAISGFSRPGRPNDARASLQTRRKFSGSLQARRYQIVRNPVNEVSVVVAFNMPFFSLFEKASCTCVGREKSRPTQVLARVYACPISVEPLALSPSLVA